MDLQRISELGFEKMSVWNRIILGVFSNWWNVFIAIQCFAVFILSTSCFAFNLLIPNIEIILYICDFFYLLDATFLFTYLLDSRVNKLKVTKTRSFIFILLDIFSLLPFQLMITFFYFSEDPDEIMIGMLAQNRTLRIYRVFLLERSYMLTIRSLWASMFYSGFSIFSKSVIIGHLLTCVWYNLEKAVSCDPERFTCFLWYEINMLEVVINNWTGRRGTFSEFGERLVITCGMISGFLLVHAYVLPYLFYFTLQLCHSDCIHYSKQEKLTKLLKNLKLRRDLRLKVKDYYTYVCLDKNMDMETNYIFSTIPMAESKEVFTDIYWEAFRHSYLFREASRNFKRNLSLVMSTEYHHDGEVIYFKGEEKKKMIYIAQGILQIMAQENENSPLLSFSSGTVFGELSLFLFTRSDTILKCKGSCKLQILTYRGASSTMGQYPKDRKHIHYKITQRIQMAKQTQWRKRFQESQKLHLMYTSGSEVADCVKWLKTQWRALWESHKRYLEIIKAKEEGTRLHAWQTPVRPEFKIEFISNNLDLLVLGELLEERKNKVCLKTKFPWFMNPSTQFLRFWRKFILVTSVIPGLVYPICTAWLPKFPEPVYIMSFIITLIFMIDVGLKFITAVTMKDKTIVKFSEVLRHHLCQPSFYLDVIAAIPGQLYLCHKMDPATAKPYVVGLFLHPAILKSYIFFSIKIPLGPHIIWLTCLKNAVMYIVFVYWLAEIIQLYSIHNIFANIFKLKYSWVEKFLPLRDILEFFIDNILSLGKACTIALSVPSAAIYPENDFDLAVTCLAKYIFIIFSFYFMADLYSSVIIKGFSSESFRMKFTDIKDFLALKKMPEQIQMRILRSLQFQWRYNNAEQLSKDIPILSAIPFNLRKEVLFETIYTTIRSCRLFESESQDFVMDFLEYADFVAVPRGVVLVTYGHISHILIVIARGYCQVTSYLVNDVTGNIGRGRVVGPGSAFPLFSSFCNIPSPVSVVTVTDCEVIMVNLNHLVSLMIKYNIFKDLVETLKEENLCEKLSVTKPALMKMPTTKTELGFFRKGFRRWNGWVKLMVTCFSTKNPESKLFLFKNLEFIYTLYLLFDCFLWPCCFGLFLFHQHILLPILLILKCLGIFHMILLMFMPYYNDEGLIITQPRYTFLHYLSSTFILDVVRLIPIFPFYYYIFTDSYTKPNPFILAFGHLQRVLAIIYVIGSFDHMNRKVISEYYTVIIKLTAGCICIAHIYINYAMFLTTDWVYGGPHHIVGFEIIEECQPVLPGIMRNNSLSDLYIVINYWIMTTLTTNTFSVFELDYLHFYLSYFHAFVGVNISFFVIAILSASSKFMNLSDAMFHREKVWSLIKYLKHEEVEGKLVEKVSSFFEYESDKMKKESIFGHMQLPLFLKEELWYPLYRSSFIKNGVFNNADEGFFKILAAHVTPVFFTRGTVIIFKDEVQSYIYILHRGKCFAYDWFMILERGSIIGDIQQTGVMENKVYALTHVEMLKISGDLFFRILNNFDTLEATVLYYVRIAESFIKSDIYRDYHPLRPVDSGDALNAFDIKTKEIEFEDESHFEDPGNAKIQIFNLYKIKQKEKRIWIIYPYSWKLKVYVRLFFLNIVLTVFFVPTFIPFGTASVEAFIIFGVLDSIFLVIVLTNFRVGLLDPHKGDIITNYKYIAKNYLRKGFFLDALSLIPFELFPLVSGLENANTEAITYLRVVRYIRMYNFYKHRVKDFGMMKNALFKKCTFVLILFIWILVLATSILMKISTDPRVKYYMDPFSYKWQQMRAAAFVFEYVVIVMTSTNLTTIILRSTPELVFFNIMVTVLLVFKAKILRNVLDVIYSRNLMISLHKAEVSKLQSFLVKNDASPILIKGVIDYKMNLFQYTHSGNIGVLKKAPVSLQISVVKDLFDRGITNFPLFQDLDANFLEQLMVRMKREIYFPGQKIVEQGDIDHRMYFIYAGEVYIINQTKDKAYVEYVVGKLHAGQYFGESTGLWFVKPHTYTYRGRTLAEIISLHLDDWEDLRRVFPEKAQSIFMRATALRFI